MGVSPTAPWHRSRPPGGTGLRILPARHTRSGDRPGRPETPGTRAGPYREPGGAEGTETDYPEFELKDGPGVNPANVGRKVPHGAILRTVATNICGSDQHMVRGRTTAPAGLVLGHEITGEVVEVGPDVEFVKVGDIVSVPFNIACGRCRNCKEGKTGICLNVNPDRPGSAYGYVDMGGWVGGQAEYVMVPYADFNLLKLPDRDKAMEKIRAELEINFLGSRQEENDEDEVSETVTMN